jgi:DeoR family transcriptional regulator, fructose operon transcriptional repressor
MLGFERKAEIATILERAGKIDVASLSVRFEVCRETIRRDLRELEKDGFVKRTHGGAVVDLAKPSARAEFPVAVRAIQRQEEKLLICKKAASMMEDGDTVFMDNSSTTLYLLRYVPRDLRVCIVTNSLRLLLEAVRVANRNLSFVCLGGDFKESNMSFSGAIPQRIARDYYPGKAFMSCASINERTMLTDSSADEVETKRLMIERSHSVVILADHTKFTRMGQVFLADFAAIDAIVTDAGTELSSLGYLEDYDLDLVVAE